MADKLTAAAWNAFAKKRELDDDALLKALGKLDKADAARHDAYAAAIDEVSQQLRKLQTATGKRKPPLPPKEAREVSDRIDAMLAEADALLQDTRDAQQAAADTGDEEESPALLTTKLIPLLRELRKGEVQMPTLICTAGKVAAVLIQRKPIATTRRKLLSQYLDGGTPKYITGHCVFERGALTFAVDTEAAGLARKIAAALLAQTELRLKVRVRGADGAEDEDGEDGGAQAAGEAATAAAQSPAAEAAPEPDGGPAFNARLAALLPKIKAAATAGHPAAGEAKLKASEAGNAARGRDFTAAQALLDELERLLATPAGAAPAAAPAAQPPRQLAPAVVYTQSRLAWGATRKKVQAELQKLEQAIVAEYQGIEVPELSKGVRKLDGVLELFDESLQDALDDALNAADPATKAQHHDRARDIIARYRGYLDSDPLVQELDGNPFVPVAVRATLAASLQTLAAKIV